MPSLWKPEIFSLVRLAAKNNEVTRIFVIRRLSNNFALMQGPTGLVGKVRPWLPASCDMHVRLHCPADSLVRRSTITATG
ncbi:penicillin-insensitive murein endopeptidase [Shigella flexneri]